MTAACNTSRSQWMSQVASTGGRASRKLLLRERPAGGARSRRAGEGEQGRGERPSSSRHRHHQSASARSGPHPTARWTGVGGGARPRQDTEHLRPRVLRQTQAHCPGDAPDSIVVPHPVLWSSSEPAITSRPHTTHAQGNVDLVNRRGQSARAATVCQGL